MRNLLLIALLLCLCVGVTYAEATIPMVNPSFEEPSIESAPYVMDTIPTGWAIMNYVSGYSYLATNIGAVVGGGALAAQDGTQALGLYSPSAMDKYLYQNTGVEIQAGVTYTVSAYVAGGSGGYSAMVGTGYSDTPTGEWNTYTLASVNRAPSAGWSLYTASGSLAAGDPNVGKYLVVYARSFGWCGFDNFSISDVNNNPGSISGSIDLGDYAGDLTLCPIRIELLEAGTANVLVTKDVRPIAETTNPIPYLLESVPPGTYDIRFSATQWLRKSLKDFVMQAAVDQTGVDVILTNGDADGDNEITSTDLSIPLKNSSVSGN